jgi:hypothetical protein
MFILKIRKITHICINLYKLKQRIMKLHYISFAFLVAGLSFNANAQNEKATVRKSDERVNPVVITTPSKSTKPSNPAFTNKAVILSQDFEATTFPPANWQVLSGAASTTTVATQDWHRRAIGGYPQNIDAFNGTNPGGCAAILYVNSVDQHDEYLISPEVTLPSGGDYQIAFDFATSAYWHITTFDNADIMLKISTDGGTTWSAPVWQEDDQALLDASYSGDWIDGGAYNWFRAFVNVSSYAGQTIKFAFHYNGLDGAPFYVDNVIVEDIPENDLGITATFSGDIINDYDYYSTPVSQVKPAVVGVAMRNTGLLTQTDVITNVNITLAGNSVYTGTTDALTLAPGEIDTVWLNTGYTPSSIGVYTITFTLPTDDNTENNTRTENFATTQHTYGHDHPGGGTYRLNEDAPVAMGTRYLMNASGMLYGIDIEIADGTDEGAEVEAILYLEGENVQDLANITSKSFVIPASAIDNGITTIVFDNPVLLDAGSTYIIQVLIDQTGGDRLFVNGSDKGDADNSTVNYGPFGTNNGINHFVGWGFSPAIRMNFDQTLTTNTLEKGTSFAIYPNPARELAKIAFELNAESTIEIQMTDISGKVVSTQNVGSKTVGSHVVEINTTSLNEGIYFVNFISNGVLTTEKLVIR